MVLLDFSVFPLDKGDSLSAYVARAVDIVDRSGLPYRCHAMGTTIEGDMEPVLDVVQRCLAAMTADCDRVECSIKIDYRKGRTGRLTGKVASVEQKLGRPLRQ
jgi:uncharacterized protein (TIGR00106 family)